MATENQSGQRSNEGSVFKLKKKCNSEAYYDH